MSMPRAAMSVATSTRSPPSLNSESARVRAFWFLLPWIASASIPSALSSRVRRSAPCLVRVNTSTCRQSLLPISVVSRARLRSPSTGCTTWSITSTVELTGPTSIVCGSLSSERASVLISLENVAENSRFWRRFGSERDHALDVVDEPHVEHAVRLVEDEDLDAGEIDVALAVVVEQPARGRDQDVDAAPQLRRLAVHAGTADGDGRGEIQVAAVGLDRGFDLNRQLARGGQDQGAHRAPPVASRRRRRGGEPLQHRQHEAGGLAGAGLGAGEHVAAGKDEGNGLRLDRRRDGIALIGDRAQKGVGKPEL